MAAVVRRASARPYKGEGMLIDGKTVESGNCAYAIRMGDTNFFKVGQAKNPFWRAVVLQTGAPYILDVVFYIWASDNQEAREIERQIHKRIFDYKTINEWFNIPYIDIFCEFCRFEERLVVVTQEYGEVTLSQLKCGFR